MFKPFHALALIMHAFNVDQGKSCFNHIGFFFSPTITAGTTGSMDHHDNHPLPQQPAAAQYSHPVMAGPPTGMKFTSLRLVAPLRSNQGICSMYICSCTDMHVLARTGCDVIGDCSD